MFVKFFIDRPIFASVIAIVITLAGGICIFLLPVAQFPPITPPTVQVSANYIGASADVVEETVTTPIEQEVNGVDGMIYMSSTSANDGSMVLTVTFETGYDLNIAALDVQNRVQIAEAKLPPEVLRTGVKTQKRSPNLTLVVNLLSPQGTYDQLFLSNYADIHIKDALKRVPGVGDVTIFGARDYSMRIWLDPDKLAGVGLAVTEVAQAIRRQNLQVPAGQIGEPPAPSGQEFQYPIITQGRLADVSQFEDIIIRTRPDGSILRVKDVARVELGAQSYSSFGRLNGIKTIPIGIFQLPGANSVEVADRVRAEMDRLARSFPQDVNYKIIYDTTLFVTESIYEVILTLFFTMALVFLVTFIFIQDWRVTMIPGVTIPVSLVGTFVLLRTLGFSINTLTLFGLVLAVGLVVDDAIVVVENTSRYMEEKGLGARQAAVRAMGEIVGPIIATTLVLFAVFVPVAFLPGTSGLLYRQFALTIAAAVGISTINALTLSPALCALLLRPGEKQHGWFFRLYNRGYDRFADAYHRWTRTLIRHRVLVMVVFLLLLVFTYMMFRVVPTSFLPEEDRGYFLVTQVGPEGASLERTGRILERVTGILRQTPGIANVMSVAGYNILTGTSAPNWAVAWVVLDPWSERGTAESLENILAQVQEKFSAIQEAYVSGFIPPAIPGLGTLGGFEFQLQDQSGKGVETLAEVAQDLIARGNQQSQLQGLFTSFRVDMPQLYVDLDRTKTRNLGLEVTDVFDTLQTYLGSLYVNDFNKFGRVYRVYLQAEQSQRADPEDITRLYVRKHTGEMVPLSTLVHLRREVGPQAITHFNLFPSALINGRAAPGYSSREGIDAMQRLAASVLPEGMGYAWSGSAYQELKAGGETYFILALSLVFVFLFLAAQYESWVMPLMIMLAVPLAMLGALNALWVRGIANDVYCQIGLVMLVGLASKNSILIVEFARRRREAGLSITEAAVDAARTRLRPVLMTAFTFILGVIPMVIATGAGAASRNSLGTTVFGGMLVATMLSLGLVPVLFVVLENLRERVLRYRGKSLPMEEGQEEGDSRQPPTED
ncbi:MAG: efflux RND transporter permease subunit [Thermodesulfobacteriota bacterium]